MTTEAGSAGQTGGELLVSAKIGTAHCSDGDKAIYAVCAIEDKRVAKVWLTTKRHAKPEHVLYIFSPVIVVD